MTHRTPSPIAPIRRVAVRSIRALCDERKIVLIEDCAHAFFGSVDSWPVGSVGDYSIASPKKFFPLCEGGLLVSRAKSVSGIEATRPGWAGSLRMAFDLVDLAAQYGRLRRLAPAIAAAKRAFGRGGANGATGADGVNGAIQQDPSSDVSTEQAALVAATATTRWAFACYSQVFVAKRRLENFAAIAGAAKSNPRAPFRVRRIRFPFRASASASIPSLSSAKRSRLAARFVFLVAVVFISLSSRRAPL